MKHKLQTLLKHNWRTLLLLLTLMTICQSALAANFDNRRYYYFKKPSGWSGKVYLIVGRDNNAWSKAYEMSDSETDRDGCDIYKVWCDFDNIQQGFFSNNTCGTTTSGNNTSISTCVTNKSSYTSTKTFIVQNVGAMFCPSSASGGDISGTWEGFWSDSDVTNVLNGTKIMFYIGTVHGWGLGSDKGYYLCQSSTQVSSTNILVHGYDSYYGTVTSSTSSSKIWNTNNQCGNAIAITGPVAGGVYHLYNDGSNKTYADNSTALTASFSLSSSTITEGENVTLSAAATISTKPSRLQLGNDPTIVFYATTNNTTFTRLSCSGTSSGSTLYTNGLSAGTWTIIPLYSDGYIFCKGTTASLTITSSCTTPTKSQYTMASGQSATYDGDAHKPKITKAIGAGDVTKIYGSTDNGTNWTYYATGPTNAGTYKIKVNVAAGDTYCAANDIVLDNTYAITKKTPTASDFDFSNLAQTLPTTIVAVGVTPKSGISGMGSVSQIYYAGSTTLPTTAGTYAVTFNVAAGTNYSAATGLSAGNLVISKSNQTTPTVNNLDSHCGTGDYTLSASGGESEGYYSYAIVSDGTTGTATIVNNETESVTLRVSAVGAIIVKAKKLGDANYNESGYSSNKTFTFAAAPVAEFSASAESSTLNFSNTAYVSTILNTAANSNWDFKWVCDSYPTWGTDNKPTIVSSTSNSTEVRFPIEGVYTFHVGAKCKKDDSYVNSTTVTVTVSLPLCIKGPLTSSTGSWNSFTSLSNISNSNTRTYGFTAYNLGTNIREFVLDASASGDDKHHIHTSSTVGSLSLTGLDINSSNDYNLRALEALGISSSGTPVLLTITHNGGLSYNISLVLSCTTPDTKDIRISESSVCQGESVNVVVKSSQDGYIYTVYDSNSSTAGSGTGTGSDLNISVTPSAGTTYTVKAKQADACLETSMANTVDISVNERPSFTPSTGITQYAPVTVTSTALSPSWSIASKDPDVDAAWISTTSGSSTVLKAPTGTYTVSDGGPCSTNAIVVSNDTEICN